MEGSKCGSKCKLGETGEEDLRRERDPSSCSPVLLQNQDVEGRKSRSKPKFREPEVGDLSHVLKKRKLGEPEGEDPHRGKDPSLNFPISIGVGVADSVRDPNVEDSKSGSSVVSTQASNFISGGGLLPSDSDEEYDFSGSPMPNDPEEWWELEGEEEDLDLPKSPGWGYSDVDEEDPLWADKFREKYRRQTPPKYKAALERGYCPPGVEKKDDALWERYPKQIKESDGYDITDFLGLTPLTPLTPMLEFKKSPSDFKAVSAFADAAIKNFNTCMKEDDQYEVHDILTVNVSGGSCRIFIYYITFEAKTKTTIVIRASADDVEDDQGRAPLLTTFQARVLENFHTEEVEVQECRIKAPKPSTAA